MGIDFAHLFIFATICLWASDDFMNPSRSGKRQKAFNKHPWNWNLVLLPFLCEWENEFEPSTVFPLVSHFSVSLQLLLNKICNSSAAERECLQQLGQLISLPSPSSSSAPSQRRFNWNMTTLYLNIRNVYTIFIEWHGNYKFRRRTWGHCHHRPVRQLPPADQTRPDRLTNPGAKELVLMFVATHLQRHTRRVRWIGALLSRRDIAASSVVSPLCPGAGAGPHPIPLPCLVCHPLTS